MTREEAIEWIRNCPSYHAEHTPLNMAIEALSQEPRRKGKWGKTYLSHESMGARPHLHYCSECNGITVFPYNFCPNCGARMEGAEE